MNGLMWVVVSIRAAALAVGLAGQSKASDQLYALADLAEAGKVTDEHMTFVAEKLKKGSATEADFEDVLKRIDEDSARLQAPTTE